MIVSLQANVPQLITHFDGIVTIYVRQYGAGNLRLGMNQEDLRNTVNPAPGGVVDGIPQAVADKTQQYFWSGDLWIIADAAGPVVIIAPSYTTYLDRRPGKLGLPSDAFIPTNGGELSTY
jgi:hypothetical protein